ncbi:MAG: LamG-like jellyroll fold domain-containing protein [Candidatus Dormibacteria bacterium]
MNGIGGHTWSVRLSAAAAVLAVWSSWVAPGSVVAGNQTHAGAQTVAASKPPTPSLAPQSLSPEIRGKPVTPPARVNNKQPLAALDKNPAKAPQPPRGVALSSRASLASKTTGYAAVLMSLGPPTVTGLSPEAGTTAGGTVVTVTGTNFVAGSTTVTFGVVPASSVNVSSGTLLTAVTPAGLAGQIPVTVTTSNGSSATGTASTYQFVTPGPYVPLTATRICDTRASQGTQCAGMTLQPATTLSMTVAGMAGVPTNASAVYVNVTSIGPSGTPDNVIVVYPYGLAVPASNNIETAPNTNQSNLVEVPVGQQGKISVFNYTGTTDIAADVEGYVAPSPSSPPSGATGYWKLDENSGTSGFDATGAGHTAAFIGATPYWTGGRINAGANLNGGDALSVSSEDLTSTSQVSLSFWWYFASFPTDLEAIAFGSQWGTGNDFWVGTNAWTQGKIEVATGSASYNIVDYSPPGAGWHHYVVVLDRTLSGALGGMLYIDGVAAVPTGVASSNAVGGTFSNGTITLGGSGGTAWALHGALDEVGLWNRALAAGEVATLDNRGSGLQYPFNAASTTAGLMNPLSPAAALCDTLPQYGTVCQKGPFAAGETRTVHVTGQAGIPSGGVQAAVIDLTVLPNNTAPGYFIVWPTGTNMPLVSFDLYGNGIGVTERIVVPVGADGQIKVFNSGPGVADIVMDAFAYTTDGSSPAQQGLDFDDQAISRACDTRSGSGFSCSGHPLVANTTQTYALAGLAGIPSANVTAVAINVSVVAPASGLTDMTVWPSGASQPAVTDVVGAGNDVDNFDMIVLLGPDGINVRTTANTDLVIDVEGYYTNRVPLPTIQKSILSAPEGNGNLFGKGEAVQWQVVVSNPLSNAEIPVSGITDMMDTTLLHGGPPKFDGSSCQPTTGSVRCTVGDGYVTASGFTLGYPGDPNGYPTSHTLTYYTVVGGKDVQCNGVNNTAVVVVGGQAPGVSAPVAMTGCDAGLGLEPWWSYVSTPVDPTQTAQVNVANGNLVVQALDSTPIQSHGLFDFVLRRTYNSQDSSVAATTDVNGKNGGGNGNGIGERVPQGFGNGWQLNVGDLSASSTGPGLGSSLGLIVPNNEAPGSASAVTFVDGDGTRHVYQFNALAVNGVDITQQGGGNGLLHSLYPHVLHLDSNSHGGSHFSNLCVDESFSAPPGMHLSLYRYMETDNACSSSTGTTLTPATLGFEAVKPDGTRYEFSWDGHLLAMVDTAGNTLTYNWANNPSSQAWNKQGLGALQSITDSAGRGFSFSYLTNETDVTDPAGRVTRYLFDSATPQHLTAVINPDGSSDNYTYGGCSGTADQLCSITDLPRNTTVSFTYTMAAVGGGLPGYYPWLATVTDRNGTRTSMTYANATGSVLPWTTADSGGERTLYNSIDASGRVGEVDQGIPGSQAGSVTPVAQTFNTWDTAAAPCEQSDNAVNNNLCRVDRVAGGSTPDEVTTYTYNPEGQVLNKHQAVSSSATVDTSSGWHTQIFEASSGNLAVHCWDDTVTGSGGVSSGADSSGACLGGSTRVDKNSLYEISDPTQMLTPRGNAAGSGNAPYLTTYLTDDNSAISPNYTPNFGSNTTQICANPSAPASNTGKVCEVQAPSFDNGTHANSVTLYTYDGYGQKNTMTTPKAVAESGGASVYSYYPDSQKDYGNHTSMGGWLQGVTDPTGAFVAFAYDAAGDVVRSWSRDATAGLSLSSFPGSANNPPSTAYQQTLYAASLTGSPWRYALSNQDPLAHVTTYTVDADGNRLATRPPRGSVAGTSAYDVTQGFDGNDNLVCTLTPAEANGHACAALYTGSSSLAMSPAPPSRASISTYDAHNNKTLTEDMEGGYTGYTYDTANRQTSVVAARGPTTTTSVANCVASQSVATPMPSGQEVCVTSSHYDMVGNVVQSQDAAGQVTSISYDGLHRVLFKQVPRNGGGPAFVYTGYQYDADGHTVDGCSPRQYAEGGLASSSGACATSNSNTNYSTISTYDVAGRLRTSSTSRDWALTYGGLTTLTTTYGYDGDGSQITTTDPGGYISTTTYNVLDRKTASAVPRDHNVTYETTAYTFDPSGNELSATAPNGTVTAYSYDANNRVVDTVQGSSSIVAASAGTASSDGGSNVRTRHVYDPDGHVIGRYAPGAFVSSVTSPNPSFLARTDYDADGRSMAQVSPRYDTSSTYADTGVASQQRAQCTTTVPGFPNGQSWGLQAYSPLTGVCVATLSYDPSAVTNPVTGSNLGTVKLQLPTSTSADSNPYVVYSSTEDHLLAYVTGPDPRSTSGARVTAESLLYDADGRTVSQADANGLTTTTSYTSDGLTYQVTAGSSSHVTTYGYNASGNKTSVNDGVTAQTTTTAYSSDGVDTQVTDGAGDTTADYHNEPARSEQVFSPNGWAAAASNPAFTGSNGKGQPVVNSYTGDGLLATQTIPVLVTSSSGPTVQQQLSYSYDPAGWKTQQVTSSVSAGGQPTAVGKTALAYYNDGRLKTQTAYLEPNDTGAQTIATTYDPAGQTASVQDTTSGTTVTAGYFLDELMRTANDGSRSQTYGYDGLGQLAARQDTNGSTNYLTTYSYLDSENAATMVSAAENGGSTSWGYDAGGRPLTQTDPSGLRVTASYNADGSLNTETYGSSGAVTGGWCYGYNGAFQVTSSTFGTGSSPCTSSNTTYAYGYDSAGRVNSFTPGTGASAISVAHDPDGNRQTYTDPASGLSSVYCYRADDSIAQQLPGAGSSCVSPPTGTATYTYTSGFDQVSSLTTSSSAVASYCYDVFGRLSSALQSASISCASPPASASLYTYDGLNRQVSHRDPNASGPTVVHEDGLSQTGVLEDMPGQGEVAYALTPSGGHAGLMSAGNGSSVQYLVPDESGSIAAVFGGTTTPTCGRLYDPFGTPEAALALSACNQTTATNSGGNTPNTFYYRDGRKDPSTGAYQLGARTYDPAKGSFLTADAYTAGPSNANAALVQDPLTQDRYNYVNGDPVNLSDPSGHRFTTGDDLADAQGSCGDLCNPLNQDDFVAAKTAVVAQVLKDQAFYASAPAAIRRELDTDTQRQLVDATIEAHAALDLSMAEDQSFATEALLLRLEKAAEKAGDHEAAQAFAALYAKAVQLQAERDKCGPGGVSAGCTPLPTSGACFEGGGYLVVGGGGSVCLVESNYGLESGLAFSHTIGLGLGGGGSFGGFVSDAQHIRDLEGPFVDLGFSVGPFALGYQNGNSNFTGHEVDEFYAGRSFGFPRIAFHVANTTTDIVPISVPQQYQP